ncbi:hypothetical protein [Mycobacterium sp. HUMS_1102779]|uniref:hypothetical protein n=1 Tax=Mycobacterium sp. HUMS_1102779 TaxID=3383487 RepID=UPI003899A65C
MTELGTRTSPFTDQDKHYLAVIHKPCVHNEVLDTTHCRSWGQGHWKWPDDRTLVNDAHEVCAVESDAPIDARIRTGGSFLAARHLDFFDLQVGVEEVAARNVYCPSAVAHPADQEPRIGGAAPTVHHARDGSGHLGDVRAS